MRTVEMGKVRHNHLLWHGRVKAELFVAESFARVPQIFFVRFAMKKVSNPAQPARTTKPEENDSASNDSAFNHRAQGNKYAENRSRQVDIHIQNIPRRPRDPRPGLHAQVLPLV